jgi:NADH-quinone oxidoreductase subunit L
VTILGVAVSSPASWLIFQDVEAGNTFNATVYTWLPPAAASASKSAS